MNKTFQKTILILIILIIGLPLINKQKLMKNKYNNIK